MPRAASTCWVSKALTGLRLINRYDVEGIDRRPVPAGRADCLQRAARWTPPTPPCPQAPDTFLLLSTCPASLTSGRTPPASASSCISQGERPTVRTARVYLLEGELTAGRHGRRSKSTSSTPWRHAKPALRSRSTLKMEYAIPTERGDPDRLYRPGRRWPWKPSATR